MRRPRKNRRGLLAANVERRTPNSERRSQTLHSRLDVRRSAFSSQINSKRFLDFARNDRTTQTRRRVLLRDISQAGDAAHLPADHGAGAARAVGTYTEARERDGVPVRQDRHRPKTDHARGAAVLVSAASGSAVADLGARSARAARVARARGRAPAAHFLLPHRRPSLSAPSRVGAAGPCRLSWRRCFGRYAETRLSRADARDVRCSEPCARPLRIVAARSRRAWLRRNKDRDRPDRNPAEPVSIS